ncbi:hypothetical protein EON80_06040 [bacterium]|nr:MAG: hypothetical protein EON80_06040 [bacterium]
MATPPTPHFRSEEWQQTQGKGHLELRGGDLEIALFVGGVPLIYDAADCEGSVGRFTALLACSPPLGTAEAIGVAAAGGFSHPKRLWRQIESLLRVFPNGRYQLTLEQLPSYKSYSSTDCHREPGLDEDTLPGTLGYYPYPDFDPVLLWTQPESSLDDETVNRYMALIDSGHLPALITVGAVGHDARFILDGHHKQFAYWHCGVKPLTLHIEFQEIAPISIEQAREVLGERFPAAKWYLKDLEQGRQR